MNTPLRQPIPSATQAQISRRAFRGSTLGLLEPIRRWLKSKHVASLLGISSDTVERRALPWQPLPVPQRLRYKLLRLDPAAEPERRYYLPDAVRLLQTPPTHARPVSLLPRFR